MISSSTRINSLSTNRGPDEALLCLPNARAIFIIRGNADDITQVLPRASHCVSACTLSFSPTVPSSIHLHISFLSSSLFFSLSLTGAQRFDPPPMKLTSTHRRTQEGGCLDTARAA